MSERDETTAGPIGALFSTTASDNAEVVPPTEHRGPDYMWSTAANAAPSAGADEVIDAGIVDGEVVDDGAPDDSTDGPWDSGAWERTGPWDHTGGQERTVPPPYEGVYPGSAASRAGGVFSSEPVARHDDVLDADVVDDDRSTPDPLPADDGPFRTAASGAPLFASERAEETAADPWERHESRHTTHRKNGASRPRTPFAAPRHDEDTVRRGAGSPRFRRGERLHDAERESSSPRAERHVGWDDGAADPNGLREAVGRLDPLDVERAAVPIAVCGALLHPDEWVVGAITGQMLGRPAVIVVTGTRVLIVNDRRWQPIVDEFAIDASLIVRGRHDRNVAALSFADSTRLAMVDGINEVGLAIDLAERIRDVGSS